MSIISISEFHFEAPFHVSEAISYIFVDVQEGDSITWGNSGGYPGDLRLPGSVETIPQSCL